MESYSYLQKNKGIFIVITSCIFASFSFMLIILPCFLMSFIIPELSHAVISYFTSSWMLYVTGLFDIFGSKLFVYCEDGKIDENSLIISNQNNKLDWLYYIFLKSKYFFEKNLKIHIHDDFKYIPVFGWITQLDTFLYNQGKPLEDKEKIKKYVNRLCSIKQPTSLLLFCEGINLYDEAKETSDQYAEEKNLPKYKHVIHPPISPFMFIYRELVNKPQSLINCVMDCTIAYKGEKCDDEIDVINNKFQEEAHILIEKFKIEDMPKEKYELFNWLKIRWKQKEETLEYFYQNGCFPNQPKILSRKVDRNSFIFSCIMFMVISLLTVVLLIFSLLFKLYFLFTYMLLIVLSLFYDIDEAILSSFHENLEQFIIFIRSILQFNN